MYLILEGRGVMTVGGETQEVGPGDCIFIPSETPHGIRNPGEGLLIYFSAAAPAFDTNNLLALWPLGSESEDLGERGS